VSAWAKRRISARLSWLGAPRFFAPVRMQAFQVDTISLIRLQTGTAGPTMISMA